MVRSWTRALPRIAASCAVLSLTSGCSVLAVRPGPSVDPATGQPACSSRPPLVVDGVAAATLALGGVVAVGIDRGSADCGSHPSDARCQFSVVPYVPAAVAAASLAYGLWAASRCEGALPRGEAELPSAARRVAERAVRLDEPRRVNLGPDVLRARAPAE